MGSAGLIAWSKHCVAVEPFVQVFQFLSRKPGQTSFLFFMVVHRLLDRSKRGQAYRGKDNGFIRIVIGWRWHGKILRPRVELVKKKLDCNESSWYGLMISEPLLSPLLRSWSYLCQQTTKASN